MIARRPLFLPFFLAFALLAAACGGRGTPALETATLAAATWTPAPSHTPNPTATAPALPSLEAPTATLSAAPSETPAGDATALPDGSPTTTSVPAGTGTNLAEFVADVTVPDGSDFAPDEAFVKTWQLRNIGTATWTTDYRLGFVSGEQMGGPATVNLPAAVPPGGVIDISVNLVAPTKLGTYTGFWMLSTPGGTPFGIGAGGNQPIYVQIDTIAGGGGTPQPTAPAGTIAVSGGSMSVAEANLSGACPQTFQFSFTFTSSGAGTVSYRLEASADDPAFTFNLPEPSNSIFTTAGPRDFTVTYDLQFTNSVSGQVWAHVTTPTELVTNKVNFSLTCAATGTSTNTPTP